jgi:hypothetical protein
MGNNRKVNSTVESTSEKSKSEENSPNAGGANGAGPQDSDINTVEPISDLDIEAEIQKEYAAKITDEVPKRKRGRPPGSKNKANVEPEKPLEIKDIDRQLSNSVVLMYEQLLKQIGGETAVFNDQEKSALVESWALVSAQYDMASKNAPLAIACIVTVGITVGKVFSPEAIKFRKARKAEKLNKIGK